MSDEVKKARRSAEVEGLLRQFLKLESGLGNKASYQRGWIFNFEFTQDQRDAVSRLMAEGLPFEEAFDKVRDGTG